MSISVLILTKNEEHDLPGCLQSVSWCDDVHVYDSYSEDMTVQIARNFDATVTQRSFDNWAEHQNWGLKNIKFKYQWVFYLDADERMTPQLVQSAREAIRSTSEYVAFRVRRKDYMRKTWLKHVQVSPFYIRLFRPECVRYERLVNPVTNVCGSIGMIGGDLDHFPFSKGVTHWLNRHNSYSTLEAKQIILSRSGKREFDF